MAHTRINVLGKIISVHDLNFPVEREKILLLRKKVKIKKIKFNHM